MHRVKFVRRAAVGNDVPSGSLGPVPKWQLGQGVCLWGRVGARGTSTVGPAGRDLVRHSRVHDVTGCGLHEAMLWKRVSVRKLG